MEGGSQGGLTKVKIAHWLGLLEGRTTFLNLDALS